MIESNPIHSDEEPNRKRRKTDGTSGGTGHGKFMEGVSDTIKPVPDNILKEIQHKCCQLSGKMTILLREFHCSCIRNSM